MVKSVMMVNVHLEMTHVLETVICQHVYVVAHLVHQVVQIVVFITLTHWQLLTLFDIIVRNNFLSKKSTHLGAFFVIKKLNINIG